MMTTRDNGPHHTRPPAPVPVDPDGIKRLVDVSLDKAALAEARPEIEYERRTAIADLLAHNSFDPVGHEGGPYKLALTIAENRLVFQISTAEDLACTTLMLSLKPFRTIVRDYFLICESYYEALSQASPRRIEAVDMGRRGLHNEGAELLRRRLDGKISLDIETARRMFTLICALHWKGLDGK